MINNFNLSRFISQKILDKFSDKQRALRQIKRKDIISLEEAAIYANRDLERIIEVLKGKGIPGCKLGDKWYVPKGSVYRYFGWEDFHENLSDEDDWHPQNIQFTPSEPEIVTQFWAAYEAGQRVFDEITMVGADLSNANLSRINFNDAILVDTNFSNTDLSGANLNHSCLQNVNLSGANLIGTNFYYADLNEADLRGANLTNAILCRAKLSGSKLDGAILNGTKF